MFWLCYAYVLACDALKIRQCPCLIIYSGDVMCCELLQKSDFSSLVV